MTVGMFSLDDKLAALDIEIKEARQGRRDPGSALHHQYEVLKAIADDVRVRQQLPRSNLLGSLEREVSRLRGSKTAAGFDLGRMTELANLIVSRWPTISQALEQFGEESAE